MSTTLTPLAQERLQAWSAERPVLGLMGEFSAGKSTLANFLLGRDVLPENVTATQLPAVWITYSVQRSVEGLRHDGTLEPISFQDLNQDVRDSYLLLRVSDDAEFLRQVDLVDTPGLSDPKLEKGATLYLGPYLDFVLWCSSAIQAWRKTEKTVWLQFPERLRTNSLLVLTRADKVRSEKDLQKVVIRVARETEELFRKVIPLSTPAAISALRGGDTDAHAWETSGGASFMVALSRVSQQVNKAPYEPPVPRDHGLAIELDPTPTDTIVELPVRDEQDTLVPQPPTDELHRPPATVSCLAAYRAAQAAHNTPETFAQALTFLEQFEASIICDLENNPAQQSTLRMCLSVGVGGNIDLKRLLDQVESEVADFDKEPRCKIFPV